jgi:UDP-N-acetylmuramoyl-tripeptide--D-alanyl-D-alanine ligase
LSQLTSSLIRKTLKLPTAERDQQFVNLSSDSRTILAGSCFVALTGEQSDGHLFIEKAVSSGATGIIHRADYILPLGLTDRVECFAVPDTLIALRKISHTWRKFFNLPLVAVAGSAGKTTSKELIAAILRSKWRNVLQTQASQNGFQGIPATLMKLSERHEAAVIEIGIDEPAAMEQHLAIVEPTHGLLTSIGEEHLEKLVNLQTVAEEEGFLFKHLAKSGGYLCIQADDKEILAQSRRYSGGRRLYYSLEKAVPDGTTLVGEITDEMTLFIPDLGDFPLPLPGRHNALNVLGAIAMGRCLGLSHAEILAGLQSFVAPQGRSELHLWRGNINVYCDTYNANPLSMKVALALLDKTKSAGHTWACLGDMLELGTEEESFHRSLATVLSDLKVDHILLCGPKMLWLESELKKRKFSGTIGHFQSPQDMSKPLQHAQSGDRILIKGSRGMRMEQLWEKLNQP